MHKELILKVSQLPWQIYKREPEQWDYEGCKFIFGVLHSISLKYSFPTLNNRQYI